MKLVLAGLLLAIGIISTVTPPSFAATCGGVQTSIIDCPDQKGTGTCPDGSVINGNEKCSDGSSPKVAVADTGVWGILLLALNILSAGVGVAALGGVVFGAVLYISAAGSSDQVKKAIGIFTNVAIGVVAYAGMYALLNFLIPGGLFNAP